MVFWRKKRTEGRLESFPDTYMLKRETLNQYLLQWLPQRDKADVILLLCHFPSTYLQLEGLLQEQSIGYQVVSQTIGPQWLEHVASESGESRRVILGLSQQLDPARVQESSKYDPFTAEIPQVSVLVAERHFLGVRDGHIASFLRQVRANRRLGFFAALDDPLFRHYVHRALQLLLLEHGMTDDKAIQSQLVARQIRHVQNRYRRQVPQDDFVSSPEEWLTTFCPNLI